MNAKKIVLNCLFGLAFSLVALEVILRLIGWSYSALQHRSEFTDRQQAIRILCVGESTTALGLNESYPHLLQQSLDQRYGTGRYAVINAGVPAINSKKINEQLPKLLENYQPQLVITMVGINDRFIVESDRNFLDLRVLKLADWVHSIYRERDYMDFELDFEVSGNWYATDPIRNLASHSSEASAERAVKSAAYPAALKAYAELGEKHNPSEQMLWNLAISNSQVGEIEKAREYFQRFLQLRASSMDLFSIARYWMSTYHFRPAEQDYAVKLLQQSLEKDPQNKFAAIHLASLSRRLYGDNAEAEILYRRAIDKDPCFLPARAGLAGLYATQGRNPEALEIYTQCLDVRRPYKKFYLLNYINLVKKMKGPEAAQTLADTFSEIKDMKRLFDNPLNSNDTQKVEKYLRLSSSPYYSEIAEKIRRFGARHIAMQYPTLDIEELQNQLGRDSGIVFVENEDNFKQAIQKSSYDDVFYDRFAFSFGHATAKGNQLIVDRLLEVLQHEHLLPQEEK